MTYSGQLIIQLGQRCKMEMLSHLVELKHMLFHLLKLMVQQFIFRYVLEPLIHLLVLTLLLLQELLIVQ